MNRYAVKMIGFFAMVVLGLAGCGGGSASAPATDVVGVAATGKALANATVTLIDSKGAVKTATTSATGAYNITVTNLTAPFVIKVDAGSGKFLYSYATAVGTSNINPFSDLAVRSAAGVASLDSAHAAISSNISTAKAQLTATFQSLLTTYSVPADDPITSSYAIGNKLDKMFDDISVTVSNTTGVTITNVISGATIYTAPVTNVLGGTISSNNIPTPTGGTSNSTSYLPLTVGSKRIYWNSNMSAVDTEEIQSDGRNKVVISGSSTPSDNVTLYQTFTSDNTGIYLSYYENITNSISYTYSPIRLVLPSNTTVGSVTNSSYAYTPTGSTPVTHSVIITVLGVESVTVPAGTFNAVKLSFAITKTSSGITTSTTDYYWFAAGIGVVQKAYSDGVPYLKLTSYSIK